MNQDSAQSSSESGGRYSASHPNDVKQHATVLNITVTDTNRHTSN